MRAEVEAAEPDNSLKGQEALEASDFGGGKFERRLEKGWESANILLVIFNLAFFAFAFCAILSKSLHLPFDLDSVGKPIGLCDVFLLVIAAVLMVSLAVYDSFFTRKKPISKAFAGAMAAISILFLLAFFIRNTFYAGFSTVALFLVTLAFVVAALSFCSAVMRKKEAVAQKAAVTQITISALLLGVLALYGLSSSACKFERTSPPDEGNETSEAQTQGESLATFSPIVSKNSHLLVANEISSSRIRLYEIAEWGISSYDYVLVGISSDIKNSQLPS